MGTLIYMAPEVVLPKESEYRVGRGIDMWSLGICWYYLLYDKFPDKHKGCTKTEVMFAIRDKK